MAIMSLKTVLGLLSFSSLALLSRAGNPKMTTKVNLYVTLNALSHFSFPRLSRAGRFAWMRLAFAVVSRFLLLVAFPIPSPTGNVI